MAAPSRFPNGVTTVAVNTNLGMFPMPDPSEVVVCFNDFNQYVAGDWTVTNTTSHDTIGLVAASSTIPAGGVLGIVAGGSTTTSDIGAIQTNPLNFYFSSTQPVWFYAHLNTLNASNEQILLGITSSNATLAPSDGIYFNKAAGGATVDFVVRKSSTSTTQSAIATLTAATNVELGFYYNGKDAVDVFVNEVKVYSQTVLTNLPTATALGPTIGMKSSATAPTSGGIYTDFILAAQGRSF